MSHLKVKILPAAILLGGFLVCTTASYRHSGISKKTTKKPARTATSKASADKDEMNKNLTAAGKYYNEHRRAWTAIRKRSSPGGWRRGVRHVAHSSARARRRRLRGRRSRSTVPQLRVARRLGGQAGPSQHCVLVLDEQAFERLPLPLSNPERIVLITRQDPPNAGPGVGCRHRFRSLPDDPLSTVLLAIMAAALRVAKTSNSADPSGITPTSASGSAPIAPPSRLPAPKRCKIQ